MRLANLHRPVLVEVHLLRLLRHPLSTAPTPWERPRARCLSRGPLPPSPPHQGATGGSFWDGEKVRSRRHASNSRLSRPVPRASDALGGARFVAAGATTRGAEGAAVVGPTARVPGIAAAPAPAVAALLGVR